MSDLTYARRIRFVEFFLKMTSSFVTADGQDLVRLNFPELSLRCLLTGLFHQFVFKLVARSLIPGNGLIGQRFIFGRNRHGAILEIRNERFR